MAKRAALIAKWTVYRKNAPVNNIVIEHHSKCILNTLGLTALIYTLRFLV